MGPIDELAKAYGWKSIKKIEKGWSEDQKYYIETESQQKLVLRLSEIKQYEKKKREFEMIKKYATLGFELSKPLEFGVSPDGQTVFQLLTWVEGMDLETALPTLSEEEQYWLGTEAGKILKKIHSIPVPKEELPTSTKRSKKMAQIKRYMESSVRIENDEIALQFIFESIDKIWAKPPVYQHGDFHPGNLILTPDHQIGVIDFNRWEVGDPYEEFYKLQSFGTEVSIPYCVGQIDGYFDEEVPEEFWGILAVYVAHASLHSIKWAEKFGQADIDHMVQICMKAFEHYELFTRRIPTWYSEYKKLR